MRNGRSMAAAKATCVSHDCQLKALTPFLIVNLTPFFFQDDAARVDFAHRLILGRAPTAQERTIATQHLASATGREEGWTEFIHALFASADFRYLD